MLVVQCLEDNLEEAVEAHGMKGKDEVLSFKTQYLREHVDQFECDGAPKKKVKVATFYCA